MARLQSAQWLQQQAEKLCRTRLRPSCAHFLCAVPCNTLPCLPACLPTRCPCTPPSRPQGPGFLILAILGWVASKVLDNPPEWLQGLVAGEAWLQGIAPLPVVPRCTLAPAADIPACSAGLHFRLRPTAVCFPVAPNVMQELLSSVSAERLNENVSPDLNLMRRPCGGGYCPGGKRGAAPGSQHLQGPHAAGAGECRGRGMRQLGSVMSTRSTRPDACLQSVQAGSVCRIRVLCRDPGQACAPDLPVRRLLCRHRCFALAPPWWPSTGPSPGPSRL